MTYPDSPQEGISSRCCSGVVQRGGYSPVERSGKGPLYDHVSFPLQSSTQAIYLLASEFKQLSLRGTRRARRLRYQFCHGDLGHGSSTPRYIGFCCGIYWGRIRSEWTVGYRDPPRARISPPATESGLRHMS